MENTRFLFYLLVLGMVFLFLGTIKSFLPHKEPERPIDYVGMALYRPVLYGFQGSSSATSNESKTQEDIFVDAVQDEAPLKKEDVKKERVEKTSNVKQPVKKSTPTNSKSGLTDSEYFEDLVRDYKANVLTERKYRNDVVVRYYKHVPDEKRAEVLVDYGFYLHERPVRDSVRNQTIMSNVIYYGQDFPISDLKLITYLLVNNGLEIKEIRRFKDFDGWKRNAIEIGGDPRLDDDPIISLLEIRNLQ